MKTINLKARSNQISISVSSFPCSDRLLVFLSKIFFKNPILDDAPLDHPPATRQAIGADT
tara:strand:- start:1243 stop:1422 length:180 start_codon:yes stop_codon:yes gene_type:complete